MRPNTLPVEVRRRAGRYLLRTNLEGHDLAVRRSSGGLTPAAVIATFKTIQMVDVHVPTTDGRELVMTRYNQSLPAHRVLRDQLHLTLPEQPPPKITSTLNDRPQRSAV